MGYDGPWVAIKVTRGTVVTGDDKLAMTSAVYAADPMTVEMPFDGHVRWWLMTVIRSLGRSMSPRGFADQCEEPGADKSTRNCPCGSDTVEDTSPDEDRHPCTRNSNVSGAG